MSMTPHTAAQQRLPVAVPSLPPSGDALAAAAGAEPLLPAFRDGDSLFVSSGAHLHARGVRHALRQSVSQGLIEAARQALTDTGGERRFLPLIGAVPFSHDDAACLWIPEQIVLAPGRSPSPPPIDSRRGIAVALAPRMQSVPEPQHYRRNVADALVRIADGTLEKVVMSRSLRISSEVSIPALLGALRSRNPNGYTFAMDLACAGTQGRSLIGSSPELLLSKRGGRIVSNPLAGSIPRAADPLEDQHRAQALLVSAKDSHEHAYVVDAVVRTLRPWCSELDVPAAPSLLATPTMWHLSTEIGGRLHDANASALEIALALHPTPAVCGHPCAEARALIERIEGFPRGLFTGLVGWCDAQGDGEWAVSIRCAEVGRDGATLYAGAGIVAGSDPDAELAETTAKMATMLQAIGLAPTLEGA